MTSNTKSVKGGKQNADRQLHFPEKELTPDQILQNGQQAAMLLDSPVLNLAFESVIKELQDQWLSSNPEEVKKREWLYTKAQALGVVALELAGFVNMAKEIDQEALLQHQIDKRDADEDLGLMQ